MKKFISLFLGMVMVLSFAACSSDTTSSSSESSAAESSQQATETESTASAADSSSSQDADTESGSDSDTDAEGKALVVYYSATGNTQEAANYISQATGADIFELEPVEPYTDDDLNWTDENSRVVYEHDNPDARDVELVADTVENWDSYDTVFIGYPIWWGIAAWPVDGFIEANDFTGKTVIPFCTSASSGLGESGQLLAEAAGSGNWLEGERFPSSVSEESVQAWIDSLGL